jgi:hypothetical protein
MEEAYNTPFVGSAATDFIDFLGKSDDKVRAGNTRIYAKAVSIVQSSGTGKSRTLTEVCSLLSANHII